MTDTVVLIQARWRSSRLPGKVLLPLAEKPALAHVISRCRAAAGVARVVVATTTEEADDVVAEKAVAWGADVFRGSEDDVLGRMAAAAGAHPADRYIRVTADCPLLDPAIIADVVAAHVAGGHDFTYNDVPCGFPRGYDVEVITPALLSWLAARCRDAASREHVTVYLFDHPGDFNVRVVEGRPGADYSTLRLVLDEAADYELLGRIFDRLGNRPLFGLKEVLALLAAEPELAALNRGVKQKTWARTPPAK